MHPNYLNLSGQYASFLAALGGISITVFALVLALKFIPGKSRCYAALVISLVVATLACFAGAHLMSQTAALIEPQQTTVQVSGVKQGQDNAQLAGDAQLANAAQATKTDAPSTRHLLGARHFVYASVNVYFALMLFGFSIMLLPEAYITQLPAEGGADKKKTQGVNDQALEGANNQESTGVEKKDAEAISTITKALFCFVLGSAYFWTLYYYSFRLSPFESWWRVAEDFGKGIFVFLLIWVGYFLLRHMVIKAEHAPKLAFIILTIFIAGSVLFFARIIKVDEEPTRFDIWFFCLAVALSGASLADFGYRLTRPASEKNLPAQTETGGTLAANVKETRSPKPHESKPQAPPSASGGKKS